MRRKHECNINHFLSSLENIHGLILNYLKHEDNIQTYDDFLKIINHETHSDFINHFYIDNNLARLKSNYELLLQRYRHENEDPEVRQQLSENKYIPLKYRLNAINNYWKNFKNNCNKFTLHDNELYFKNKQYIRHDVKNVILDQEYIHMTGNGIRTFYKYIIKKYVGITRDDIALYLKRHNERQLTTPLIFKAKKSFHAKYINHIWAIDLIDMSPHITHDHHRYIITLVDIYSRRCWLRSIVQKIPQSVLQHVRSIMDSYTIPKIIISDNGSEFKGEFSTFCVENKIYHQLTPPHSPQSNGIVERKNREIRKILRNIIVSRKMEGTTVNVAWRHLLPQVENVLNNTFHSVIQSTPDEVYKELTIPSTSTKSRSTTSTTNTTNTTNTTKTSNTLTVNDFVRIKMTALFSSVRHVVKMKNTKQLIVTFTPHVFKIHKIIKKRKPFEYDAYILQNPFDNYIIQKHFHATDMILFRKKQDRFIVYYNNDKLINDIEENNNNIEHINIKISIDDAMKLNKCKFTENDIQYQHQLVREPPATQMQTKKQHNTRKSSIKRHYNSSISDDRLNKIIQFLNSNNDLRLRRKIINQMHIIMGKSAANERLQAFERVEDIIKNNVK